MPIIQPNNTTGLYGVDTTVSIGNTLFATNLNVSGNAAIGGNLLVSGNETVTGNLTVTGTLIANVNIAAPGSNTQIIYNNNGALAGTSNLSYTGTALSMTGNVSATGNVSGNYILGNGSQLTGLPVSYGNANVVTLLANFGSNTIQTTGNITGGNLITAGNVSGNYVLGNGALLTGITTSYGNANVAQFLASGTNANNISITGNVIGSFFLPGVLKTAQIQNAAANQAISFNDPLVGSGIQNAPLLAGNITSGGFFIGNGSLLTGIVSTATPGGSSGEIQYNNGGVLAGTTGFTYSPGILSSTGNVQFSGKITGLGAAEIGANLQVNTDLVVFGNTVTGNLSVSGGSITSVDTITATGNITTTANISGGNLIVSGAFVPATITATGNVAGANLNATTNTTTGNIIISLANNNIKSINAVDLNTTPSPQRITIGNGYNGNFGSNVDPLTISRGGTLAVIDKYNIGNSDTNMAQRLTTSTLYADMGGATLTNNARRLQPLQGMLFMGNGTQQISAGAVYSTATGVGSAVGIGNITVSGSTVDMGGTATVSHVAGSQSSISVGSNANVGNAVGVVGQIQTITGTSSNTTSAISFFSNFGGTVTSTTAPTNVYGFYMPGTTATHGLSNTNNWRRATNYYFLMNEDNVAQVQLGSLKRYHEFEAATATSGSFAIDKNTAQVHNIAPTGNCTITGYSNMVTSASDGTNTDSQVDTLTIIVEQGSTPYTVTLPTGSTYKYAGNVSTVGATANAVTMISVTAANVRGTVTYLTTVSPEFV